MIKLAQVEHRLSQRQTLPSHVDAQMIIGGLTYPASILDYSISGLLVKVEDATSLARAREEGFEIEVVLPKQNQTYIGQVRHSRLNEHPNEALMGVQIKSDQSELFSFLFIDPGLDLFEEIGRASG